MKRDNSRILMILPDREVKGGMTAVAATLADHLKDKAYTAEFYPSYMDRFTPLGRILYSVGRLIRFFFIVGKYDLFHIHSAANGSFCRKACYTFICKAFGKKVIFHIHGSKFERFYNQSSLNRMIIRKTLDLADAVLVLSKSMKHLTESYCSNRNIFILNNPISLPVMDNKWKKEKQEKQQKVRLLFMGEVGKRKGIYDIVQAVQMMPPDIRKNLIFYICGNNETDKLAEIVKSSRLDDHFKILGWVEGGRKGQLFSESDIYILPSYHEGLPVSILEAMSYGLPVISTCVGGIPEIVRDGYNGLIVTPGDISGIKVAIMDLAADDEKRRVFGKNGLQLAAEYEDKQVLKELTHIYEKVRRAR